MPQSRTLIFWFVQDEHSFPTALRRGCYAGAIKILCDVFFYPYPQASSICLWAVAKDSSSRAWFKWFENRTAAMEGAKVMNLVTLEAQQPEGKSLALTYRMENEQLFLIKAFEVGRWTEGKDPRPTAPEG